MRIGLIMATGIGGFTTVQGNLDAMRDKGADRICDRNRYHARLLKVRPVATVLFFAGRHITAETSRAMPE